MFVICGCILGLYIVLFVCFGRRACGTQRSGILGRMDRVSAGLLQLTDRVRSGGECGSGAGPPYRAMLERLHPGEDQRRVEEAYRVGKSTTSLLVLLAGTLLAAGLHYRAISEARLKDGRLQREDYLGQEQNVRLRTELEGTGREVEISVAPRRLSAKEREQCFSDFLIRLEETMLGANPSVAEIREDLSLPDRIKGYPFSVTWESDMPALISVTDGKVTEVEEETEAVLRAEISYDGTEWEKEWTLKLLPGSLTHDELIQKQLQMLAEESESAAREEEEWILPGQFEGEDLNWQKVTEDHSGILLGLFGVVAVALYFLTDRDLADQWEKKQKEMHRSFPEFVRKLALYIGAGMTIRGAFGKMAENYEKDLLAGKPPSPIYEELLFSCREIRAGVSEAESYERFGRRTGLQEYVRVSTLLVQNLKRGSASLLPRLRAEAAQAGTEQIQNAKKAGEEAQTKLLVPMVMMLLVVMVMVMVPAFTTMNY